ncbi:MAG: hypothetical protein LBP39_02005 [Rickettsiales bacterium]|jgi:two-component system osmolarity sensor histidine kinase EnvZ|nr:hypothetical protein [Rickettsiales bacterium]
MMKKSLQGMKKIFPSSFFYRFMLMVIVPMFLLQVASIYIFFRRYGVRNMKKNIDALVKKIETINIKYDYCVRHFCDQKLFFDSVNLSSDFRVELLNGRQSTESIFDSREPIFLSSPIKQFRTNLRKLISDRMDVTGIGDDTFRVRIIKPTGTLEYEINKNIIFIPKMNLMIFWNSISFIVIAGITFIFIKKQVKSIELLKNFANDFSYLEKDNIDFKPTGAKEVREVGLAFLNVVRKMKSLINARTTMLAQISHDLRTPLTRIKLQAEFIGDEEISTPLKQDLEEMEKMIGEYLLFARGEIEGNYCLTDLRQFFNNIIDDYRRSNYENIFINFDLNNGGKAYLKIDSFKRCMNNIINNSLRHRRKKININVKTTSAELIIETEDDGKGLAKDLAKKIKRPFYRAKDSDENNFGLGLSVVQHVVEMHQGKVYFEKSKTLGGLAVNINIPLVRKLNRNRYEF